MELLINLADFIRRLDPDILIGWDVVGSSVGYILARARFLQMRFYPITLARCLPSSYDPQKWRDPNLTRHGVSIYGRVVLNFWKVARDELSLRTTQFEGAVWSVIGRKVPRMRQERLNRWWAGGKRHFILKYLKQKSAYLAELVQKMGTIDLGAEIASVTGIPLNDAITRGSQIRQEGIFSSVGYDQAGFETGLIPIWDEDFNPGPVPSPFPTLLEVTRLYIAR